MSPGWLLPSWVLYLRRLFFLLTSLKEHLAKSAVLAAFCATLMGVRLLLGLPGWVWRVCLVAVGRNCGQTIKRARSARSAGGCPHFRLPGARGAVGGARRDKRGGGAAGARKM